MKQLEFNSTRPTAARRLPRFVSSPWNSIDVSNPPIASSAVRPHREVAAVENGTDPQDVVRCEVRKRRQRVVVEARPRDPKPVPVVEAIRPGDRDRPWRPYKPALHPLDQHERELETPRRHTRCPRCAGSPAARVPPVATARAGVAIAVT
jgi:hypothetical protein